MTKKNTEIRSSKNGGIFSFRFLTQLELTILLLPALLLFIVFNYLPIIGIVVSFKEYSPRKGILGSEWVGFSNFEFFFKSNDALRITTNTVFYGLWFIVIGIIVAVLLALLLFEVKKTLSIKIYQTAMILPNFISWVIAGFISYAVLSPVSGVANQFLNMFGLEGIDWYSNPNYWPFILTIANIWKHIGMNCVLYYAALMSIDQTLFEAAKIDGASKFQRILNISIPSLKPLMTILSILAIGNIFRGDFGLFYQIPRDVALLYPTTDIIDTYVYRGLRSQDSLGMTSAVGLFQSFVGLVLVIITNSIVKKINPENSLF